MRRSRTQDKGLSQRQLRAGELIRHALVDILQRERIREEALRGVSLTISEARMSPDLKQATVFCTPLGGAGQREVIEALNRAASHIRGLLAQRIDMKFTPSLKFRADESFGEAQRIDELLSRPEVARDLKPDSE